MVKKSSRKRGKATKKAGKKAGKSAKKAAKKARKRIGKKAVTKKRSVRKAQAAAKKAPTKRDLAPNVKRKHPVATPPRKFNPSRADVWQRAPIRNWSPRFYFKWDKQDKRYYPHSRNPGKPDIKGIWFTFFSAVGAYVIPGKVGSGAPYFYSNDVFGRAVFRSNDHDTRQGINPGSSKGIVPLKRFDKGLNDFLGTRDWRTAYREIDFRYERGMAVRWYRGNRPLLKKFIFPGTATTYRNYTARRAKQVDKARKKTRKARTARKQTRIRGL